jgi:preprotein translocase subunit SecD
MRRWLVLNDTIAMSLSQASTVDVHQGSGGSFVSLRLNMTSGDRLISTTNRHLGSHLAVILNGHLVIAPAPIIRTPLAGNLMVVPNVDSSVAAELAARLRTALAPLARP